MKQLHPGAKWVFRVRTYFSLIFILIFFASFIIPIMIASKDVDNLFFRIGFSLVAMIIVAFFIGELYSKLAYKNWKYDLTSRELKLERGIIWKKYSAIPFERVQNIDIHRGILARIIGFSTLNIQTAGYHNPGSAGAFSEGYIPAVSIEEAEKIRDFLIKKIGKKQGL
jgi:membrane protein YdbS with pleckstrin-like domain